MNYAIPSYVCTRDETKGRESPFSCTVDIGGMKYIGTAAKTKKEAELKAAKIALLAIKMSTNGGESDTSDLESVYTVVPIKRKELEWPVGETEEKLKTKKRKKGKFKRRKKRVETTRAEEKMNDDDLKLNGESVSNLGT